MMRFFKNNKGLTIVELMVSIALLSVVVALSANVFLNLWKGYQVTQEKWIIERDVKNTIDKIDKSLNLSYQLSLSNSQDITQINLEKYKRYFYYDYSEFALYFIDYDFEQDKHLIPVKINQNELTVEFSNVNEDGKESSNSINVNVSSNETQYKLSSKIYLANLTNTIVIDEKYNNYNTVEFNLANNGVLNLNADDLPDTCFIATAAYGDINQNSVIILRQFRDTILNKSNLGRRVVNFYYKHSPSIANKISDSIALKTITKILLIPVVGLAIIIMQPLYAIIIGLFSLLVLFAFKKILN